MGKKILLKVCFECGKKLGKFKGGSIGMRNGECDNCGKVTGVASAPHDFGIYADAEMEARDKIQRRI